MIPTSRDGSRKRWRTTIGAVVAMLTAASIASNSFSLFNSFGMPVERGRLVGGNSIFLVDSDATKDEAGNEADNTKSLLKHLNRELESSGVDIALSGEDGAIRVEEAESHNVNKEQPLIQVAIVGGTEKKSSPHNKHNQGKKSKTSLGIVKQENKIVAASAPGTDGKVNESSPATLTGADSSLYLGIEEGILSNKSSSFFQAIQKKVDNENWLERCKRYGPHMRPRKGQITPIKRRIFYGSLIADEPWELFEIMGVETHGIFEAMVFVESNRTQTFTPRPFQHNEATRQRLQRIFGTPKLEIRQYINENPKLLQLGREHDQRHEILLAWKEMGMGPEDIGYISDVDETMTRSFLRAVQTCPYVAPFEYERHRCDRSGGRLAAIAKVYEGSPECVTKARGWPKPDMILGACLEVIGNATEHPLAERDGYNRKVGFATGNGGEMKGSPEYQRNYANISGDHYPLWSAADLRMLAGGTQFRNTAFHLHNWFANYKKVRHKYRTYGHPVMRAMGMPIESIHDDLKLMVYCLKNLTDAPSRRAQQTKGETAKKFKEVQDYQRIEGGFLAAPKPWPIYFQDEDYRRRKHEAGQVKLQEDENKRLARLKPRQVAKEGRQQRLKEMMRQVWKHELQGKVELAEAAKNEAEKLGKEFRVGEKLKPP